MMKMMVLATVVALSSCGYSAQGNELVGQVKKVVKRTPIVCPNYTEVDVSLGVLRNGNGSMSKEDIELVVEDGYNVDIDGLKRAAEQGLAVKVFYDVKRISPCWPDHRLTSFEIIDLDAEKRQ